MKGLIVFYKKNRVQKSQARVSLDNFLMLQSLVNFDKKINSSNKSPKGRPLQRRCNDDFRQHDPLCHLYSMSIVVI